MMNPRILIAFLVTLLAAEQSLAVSFQLPSLAPQDVLGTTSYYRWRYDNFLDRHSHISDESSEQIPDYYLNYGEKYVKKFTEELYPRLSEKGQKWLVEARMNLQTIIEDEIREDAVSFSLLEENSRAFRKFAFDSHPKAYLDAGLADLRLTDLIKIGTTPSIRDLLSKDGTVQVWLIMKALSKDRVKKISGLLKNVEAQAVEMAQSNDVQGLTDCVLYLEDMAKPNLKLLKVWTRNFRDVKSAIRLQVLHRVDEEEELRHILARMESL
jgi:hypothetical protein